MLKLPQDPIFIVGYPRSGTTLLQRLLIIQPGIFSFPETHYFCVVEKQLKLDEQGRILPDCLDNVLDRVYEKTGFQFTDNRLAELTGRMHAGDLTSRDLFEFIVSGFLTKLHPMVEKNPRYRWLEKTPNHAHFMERILSMYPQAQALYILRHPVPAIFSRKLKFPFNRETPLVELARRWNRMFDDVERFKSHHPDSILTLRYENLVMHTKIELSRVGAFLNMPLAVKQEPAVYGENPGVPGGIILPSEPWKLADLRRKFSNTNNDYKTRFTREDAEAIEKVIGERLYKCGYKSYSF